jgi:hypothetical protein
MGCFMDTHDTVLAYHPDDVTVAWAQRIVSHHRPGARVSRADVLSVDVGTTTRLRIAVDHDASGFPHRWFAKLPSLSWKARWITTLPRLLQAEARFYREVARVVPVLHPSVLAGQTRLGQGSTLVLEDVTEGGAETGSPGDAWTAEQAGLAIDELARLHALLWEHPCLAREYRWLAGPVRRTEDALGSALAVPLMRRGLACAGEAVPAALHGPALGYARHRRHWMHFLTQGPRTLIHHDVHPGNFFWRDGRPGLLDWHLVRAGEGISDVAYFLATALLPETRREHETRLLTRYREALLANGVAAPEPDVLAARFRAQLAYPFEAMVVTLAVGGMMALESNLELIRRTAAAVADHSAFAAGPCGATA